MVRLEAALQPLEYFNGFGNRGLAHVNLLKATRQCVIFLEDASVLGIGGRPDALELAVGKRRLEQVRRVERTP